MGRAVGDLVAVIGADFDGFTDALQTVQDQISGAEKSFARAGAAMTAAFTIPLVAFATEALTAFGDTEKLTMGLTAVAGSADGAAKQMAELREIAKLPGLALDQAVTASIRLQNIGVSAKDAERYISAYGNAVALVGKDAPELELALFQLSQSLGKGKVLAQDWHTILDQVPQANVALRQAFGTVDTEALQKMGITSKQLNDVVVSYLETLPRATGGLANAFENLRGDTKLTFSAIGSIMGAMVTQCVDELGKLLAKVRDAVDWFKTLDPTIQLAALAVVAFAGAIGPVLLGVAAVSKTFGVLTDAAGLVIEIFASLSGYVVAAAGAFVEFAVAAVTTAVEALVTFATEGLLVAAEAIATFGFVTLPAAVEALIVFATEGIGTAVVAMAVWVATSIPAVLESLAALGVGLLAGTVSFVAMAVEGIGAVIAAMAAAYTAAIPALLVGLEAIATVLAVVVAAFAVWKLLEWVAQLDIVKSAIAAVKQGFADFVEWLMKLPAVQAIVTAFGTAWDWVKGKLSEAGAAAESAAKSAMKSATTFVGGLVPAMDSTGAAAAALAKKQKDAEAAAKAHEAALNKQITAQDKAAKSVNELNAADAAYNVKALKPLMDTYIQLIGYTTEAYKALGVSMTAPFQKSAEAAANAFNFIVGLQAVGLSNDREVAEARLAMIQAQVTATQKAGKLVSDEQRTDLANAKAAATGYTQDLRTDAQQTADRIAAAFKTLGVKNVDTARDELNKKVEAYGELVEAGQLSTRQMLTAEEALAKARAQLAKDTTGVVSDELKKQVTASEIAAGDTEGIFRDLGVKNVAVMQQTLSDHQAKYDAMTAAGKFSAQQRLQAELTLAQEQADIEKATTGRVSAELQARIDELGRKTGQAKSAFSDFGNQVSTIFTDLGKQIVDVMFDGTGSFGSRMFTVLEDIGKAFARTFLEDAMKSLTTFVETGIKNTLLGKGFGSITDALGGLFKTSATAAAPVADAAKTAAGLGSTAASTASTAAGGVASAASSAGSLLSSIGSIANIAGAVGSIGTAVLSIFQARGAAKIQENIQDIMSDVVAHLTDEGISLFFWTVAFPVWLDQSNKLGWIYDFMRTWEFDQRGQLLLWTQALAQFIAGEHYNRMIDTITQLGWINNSLNDIKNQLMGGARKVEINCNGQSVGEVSQEVMRQMQLAGWVVVS